MQKIIKIIYLFIILLVGSCTSYPEAIEDVLRQAGKNRKELEKVLKHYSKAPADSLKLRATEFLIVNMPGKYSEYYDAPWNDVATVHLRWTSSSDKQMVLDEYQMGEPVRKDDITHITAEYLINNIELAFKVWQEMPWGKDIPFDVFCEEILPYRVNTEPLENWRKKVLASFADIYNKFKEDTTISTVEACSRVNDLLPRFRMDRDFPSMNYTQLMSSARGSCDAMVALTIFVMRGLGIPVTFDFTPKWVELPSGHSWNSVKDNKSGNHISFMGTQSNPGAPHQGSTLLKAKAYRHVYAKQHNVILDEADIPPLLYNINNIVDVTSEYGNCADIWFPVNKIFPIQSGYLFLAILYEMAWIPITWGSVDADGFEFQSVSKGIMYLPVYYHNGVQTPAAYPFMNSYNGCRFFQPLSSVQMSLTSIAPGYYEWIHRMRGGKFEVANRSDFSDAKTIHTIEKSGLGYFIVPVNQKKSYRYIRYVSPAGGRCNVSILEFYDENNEKLQGTAIGTPGANATMTHDKVFDEDVDSFFEAASDPSWVGLDLGEPRKITKIRYLPRTGGNGIYEGHVYELFYWNGTEWQSLGRKTADSHILQYKAPTNALLYLKNITKNRMNKKPFYIDAKAQKWL